MADIDYANFKGEAAIVTGAARAKRYTKVWGALHGMDEDCPDPAPTGWQGLPWPEKSPVGKPRAYGGVVIDPQGRLLLREVANHFGGYVWSYAKGRPDKGESPRQAALREVHEEMGVDARILLPLPGTFGGTTTRTHFFLMTVEPHLVDLDFQSRETARLAWVWPDEARELLAQTTDATGRERDLAILEAALACLPSPLPLQRPIARRESWRNRPFPARCQAVPYTRTFTPREMAQVARGFIPTVQEQHGFAYLEDGVLHIHRSWTGFAVYRLVEPYLNAMLQGFQSSSGHAAVQAQASLIVAALTDDPTYTRMPWHSREQLGESLVALMNLDADYCAGESLALVVSESMAAVHIAARKLWQGFQADDDAPWNPDGEQAFRALGEFVVAALLGTAVVQFPGKTLRDFGWG